MQVDLDLCHIVASPHGLPYHPTILQRLFELQDSGLAHKSHFFGGRYENIYLGRDQLPGLDTILDAALAQAALLLSCAKHELQLGFWFNLMQQGNVTLPHSHDDDDELLSATYYLQVPPDAGKLVLELPAGRRTIDPVEGQFVFFHPRIEHEVTRHLHRTPRVSLGINIGPSKQS